MRGVTSVVESVLLAAAVILFIVGISGGLNDFITTVTEQRLKNSLKIDGEKVAYAILLAKKIGGEGSGEVKIYLDLASIPEYITVNDENVVVKSGTTEVEVPLYGAGRYVNTSFRTITNAKGYDPYVLYADGTIKLGVE